MFYRHYKSGWIEIITGAMFSGKSTELLRRLEILKRAKEKVQVFSPLIDDRYGKNLISNHNGWTWPAIDVKDSWELLKKLEDDTVVVVIDEIQFFDKDILKVTDELANKGCRVIVAGLTADYRHQPFPITINIMARAEFITKLESVCQKCGGPGTRTQRYTNGEPSHADEATVIIDGSDSYGTTCRHCHKVPGLKYDKIYK